MKRLIYLVCAAACTAALGGPASNNIAYKCTSNGKTVYSDAPCIGAEVVDTTPTEGMDTWTGKRVVGKDVANKQRNQMFDQAVRPITGMNHAQAETNRRRFNHEPEDRQRCYQLDRLMANPSAVDEVELFNFRTEYRKLRC